MPRVLGFRLRSALSGLSLLLVAVPMAGVLAAEPAPALDGYELIGSYVDQLVLENLQEITGLRLDASCIETAEMALCIHPDTSPEKFRELLARLPQIPQEDGERYIRQTRIFVTATNGSTGAVGDPITLTYSFLPDGLWIPSGAGEPGSASSLYARLNALFGSEAAWKQIFADCFGRWAEFIGITYIEVSDDGAAFGANGLLGARGDVRIGMHPIDGVNGVLAYNYFPTPGGGGSDMVLDYAEAWANSGSDYRFMRNIVMHEHGHGHGMAHEGPINQTKLMEAAYSGAFYGPRDDDIRGGMHNYGDFAEHDDDGYAGANPLGAWTGQIVIENHSLDTSIDTDWYSFSTPTASLFDVYLQAVGSVYPLDSLGGANINTTQIMDLGFEIRSGATGATVLLSQNAAAIGMQETLVDYALPAGNYFIKINRYSGNAVQRYRMILDMAWDDMTGVPAESPAAGRLGLALHPNPFNPKTTVRFHVPVAGPAQLEVFDLQGRLLRSFQETAAEAGWLSLSWDGRDAAGQALPSGIYFLRASAGGLSEVARGALLK